MRWLEGFFLGFPPLVGLFKHGDFFGGNPRAGKHSIGGIGLTADDEKAIFGGAAGCGFHFPSESHLAVIDEFFFRSPERAGARRKCRSDPRPAAKAFDLVHPMLDHAFSGDLVVKIFSIERALHGVRVSFGRDQAPHTSGHLGVVLDVEFGDVFYLVPEFGRGCR